MVFIASNAWTQRNFLRTAVYGNGDQGDNSLLLMYEFKFVPWIWLVKIPFLFASMSQESCFLSPMVPMLTVVKTGRFAHFPQN